MSTPAANKAVRLQQPADKAAQLPGVVAPADKESVSAGNNGRQSPLAGDTSGAKADRTGLPPAPVERQQTGRGISDSSTKLYPLSGADEKLKPLTAIIGIVVLLGLVAAAWWFFGSDSSKKAMVDSAGSIPIAKVASAPATPPEQQPIKAVPAVPEEPRGPQEGQTWAVADLNLDLVYLHAGSFVIGSPASEKGRFKNEGPQTQVTLTKGFWLGRTSVTQGQWVALMNANPSNIKGTDLPVDQVSWDDAMEFCRKMTERERAAGRLPEGYTYTLPTEAQWEYACRAGTAGPIAGDGKLDDLAWYSENSGNTAHPVGQKQQNAWGLFDMHGNVWEWCRDWFGDYPGVNVTDPTGPISGSARVVRGGSCSVPARFCRAAFRRSTVPSERQNHLGFRLALGPSP
jgi:formylglycine-generating enzyme required for sulfatase activity